MKFQLEIKQGYVKVMACIQGYVNCVLINPIEHSGTNIELIIHSNVIVSVFGAHINTLFINLKRNLLAYTYFTR